MQYKHVKERTDYSVLASGHVLHGLPGHPAFPVRLASEIFQRCLEHRSTIYHESGPCTLYDPCCGAAYHLSVLGFLHRRDIRQIVGSDIDEKAIDIAKRNLEMLSADGLKKRMDEISRMIEQYNKDSHREALASAGILKNKVVDAGHDLETLAFQADATDREAMLQNIRPGSVDIVFTDVPYGEYSQWHGGPNALKSMLDALIGVLSPASILAVVSDKRQKVFHARYHRLEQFQVGKRRVELLKPA